MANFIQEAIQELEHVVWPTSNESKKYMLYTVGTIIVMATLLAILGYALRGGLTGIRDQFPHTATTTVSGEEDVATAADLESALAKRRQKIQSGSIASGSVVKPTNLSGSVTSGSVVKPTNLSGSVKTGSGK